MSFSDYFNSTNPNIASSANLLAGIQADYQNGAITQAQYTELSNNVINDLQNELSSLATMAARQDIIVALQAFAKLVAAVV
jgi:hypothetical protein